MAEVLGLAGTYIGLSSIIATVNQTRKRNEQPSADLIDSPLGLLTLHEPSQPVVEYKALKRLLYNYVRLTNGLC